MLELRGGVLLLTRIVNVGLEEVLPETVAFAGRLVVCFLLLLGAVQLTALLALQHEEVYLDVVVGQSLLGSHACEARIEGQCCDDGCGNEGVLLRIGDTQPSELQRMVLVEAEHQKDVDGNEPCEARHAVQDASQTALFACQSGQLSVCTVKQIRHAEQQDANDIEPKSAPALVVEAAVIEENTAGSSDEHGGDGDSIGMDVQLGKEHRQKVTKRTNHAIIKPVFRLGGLECGKVFVFEFLEHVLLLCDCLFSLQKYNIFSNYATSSPLFFRFALLFGGKVVPLCAKLKLEEDNELSGQK